MATASLPVESEEMDCSVCHEHFKDPKFLTCGHLVCRQCLLPWLQAHTQGQCPLCRYPIINEHDRRSKKSLADIADSFLTDRAMAALVEAHRLLSEQHVCCVCVNVAAVSMCMDCRNMFCQQCTTLHTRQPLSRHHTVEQLRSLTEEKLAANSRRACAVHSDKLPEVFCPSHKVSVCLRCATTVHRQCPDVKDLEERVGEARVTLHDLTAILTALETEVGQQISHLDKQLTDIDQQKQAAIDELTATFDDIEAAEKASRRRLNDMIVQTSSEEKRSVNDVKNSRLGQRGKLTLHKRLVARSESIISSDDVTNMTPEIERLVKDLGRSISSQANAHVTSRIELAIDLAEVTRIKRALLDLGKGTGSSFDDGTTARINHLEQNVHQLQRDLTSAQSERARLVQQVRTLQQELAGERRRVQVVEQEVKGKDDQIKRNEAEIASCKDEIRSKVEKMEQQDDIYDQLQSELQGEKARHQDTAKQLHGCKQAYSALEKKKARHQDTAKQLHGCKQAYSTLEKKKYRHKDTAKQQSPQLEQVLLMAAHHDLQGDPQPDSSLNMYHYNPPPHIRDLSASLHYGGQETSRPPRPPRLASRLPDARTCPSCTYINDPGCSWCEICQSPMQAMVTASRPALRFHDNHEEHVVLSNNHQTAVHRPTFPPERGGIVMSRDPIEVNKLYEVHITKRGRGGWPLGVGVVTSSPDRLTLPRTASRGWRSAVAVYSACFFDHGDKERVSDVGKALDDLPEDSRVGVSLDRRRRLHLHVNGTDQGVVPCRPLPDPCWALWELRTNYSEMTCLPVRDLS